jgi:hypothetical protein
VPVVGPTRITVRLPTPAPSLTVTVGLANCKRGCSSSTIVSTAVDGLPSTAPLPAGTLRARLTVLAPSTTASATVVTMKVWLVAPAANVSVPLRVT